MTLDDAAPTPVPVARAGSTVVITGGTGGIGLATATALAATGARLVLVGRDRARGEQAVRAVGGDSSFLSADLGSLTNVRRATGDLQDAHGRPDVLLVNAGGLYAHRRTTVDGHEASLAVNLLGTYLLARDLLSGPGTSRLVHVSSSAVRRARPALDDPQSEQGYRGLDVYGRTKLYGAAALLDLTRDRPDVHLVLADPGGARTVMTDGMTPASVPVVMRAAWPLFRLVQRAMTVERAARSSVRAATDTGLVDGTWLGATGRPRPLPAPLQDRALQQQARALAERLLPPTG
jgi:NAD(P)-dependent dehydrogenase (short-subunit alcohol dehydrogenase family)